MFLTGGLSEIYWKYNIYSHRKSILIFYEILKHHKGGNMKNKIFYLIAFLFVSINSFGQVSHTVNFSLEHLIMQNYTGADEANYTKVEYEG